jgi:16S rRNA (guanine527-N7)-methyltransferase
VSAEAETDAAVAASLEEAQTLGFLGPGGIERQVRHARGFAAASAPEAPGEPTRVLDLGSGGGLPGLIVALEWPRATVVLLEASVRRCAHLRRAVEGAGLADRVEVLQARAEEAGRDPGQRGTFDVVVARSFGAPAVTAECAAPFLAVGGHLVVSEPPAPPPGIERWPVGGLAELGMAPERAVSAEFHFQLVRQVAPCPDRYPRRVGIPAKRPLF